MDTSQVAHYALGSTDAEHARLMRQAGWLAPHTERLFREAGIGSGQRVLDLGSGVGDVTLLAARLVGPSGAVVGVDGDGRSIERARARVAEKGLTQVMFVQSELGEISIDRRFDAVVGRYILMFLPDPASVLRSLDRLVRPGAAFAFQEPDWTSFLEEAARLPLWSGCARLLVETLERCGTNTDMGNEVSRVYEEVGLPAPKIRVDRLTGSESWLPDCLHSMRPKMVELGLSLEPVGDFETLHDRLRVEASAFKTREPLPNIVSVWSRKPG